MVWEKRKTKQLAGKVFLIPDRFFALGENNKEG